MHIVLDDLLIDSKYLHSASLRVTVPPKTDGIPNLYLVVTLFTPAGLKDFGVSGRNTEDTFNLYLTLLAKLDVMVGDPGAVLREKRLQLAKARRKHREQSATPAQASPVGVPSRGHAL